MLFSLRMVVFASLCSFVLLTFACSQAPSGSTQQEKGPKSHTEKTTGTKESQLEKPFPSEYPQQESIEESHQDAGFSESSRQEFHTPDNLTSEAAPEKKSRCKSTETTITCQHNTASFQVGKIIKLPRRVYWQNPVGTPPSGGWPVAIMFQGSLFSSRLNWLGFKNGPLGIYHQVRTLKGLLEAGYTVLTPVAHLSGTTFWETNIPPYSINWKIAPDHLFMEAIFAGIKNGVFGSVNEKKMFALGISSGGYMSSRMAVAYPGRFSALAIHSASYATCSGPLCSVPALPADHPPTLFLHGRLDLIVPIRTMEAYAQKLQAQKTKVAKEIDPKAGHEWISTSPQKIVDWFAKYR